MNENKLERILKFIQEGDYNQAYKKLNELIDADKNNLQYKNLLSIVLININKFKQAIEVLENILKKDPKYFDALINLGNLYYDLNKFEKAKSYFKKGLNIRPKNINLLDIYASNLIHLSKFEEADKILNNILKENPQNLNSLINLGVIATEKNNFDIAEDYFSKAISINKHVASIYYNLGRLQDKKNNVNEAIKYFLHAIKIDSNHAQSYYNLGCIYQQIGKIEDAYSQFKIAISLKPNYIDAIINFSRIQLSKHEFNDGWLGYELRQGGVDKTYKILNVNKESIWDGRQFDGDLIIHGEQGLGDQILFSSILKDLRDYCENIIVTVDKRLIDMMKRSFSNIIFLDKLEPIKINKINTKNILLGSLGKFFRKNINDFEYSKKSWLHVSKSKKREIQSTFSFSNKIKVGISWKGGSVSRVNRQIDIQELSLIFNNEKYELVNLQHDNFIDDINLVSKKSGRKITYSKNFDYKNNLDGVLALINECDIIVTLGNTVAHLSSALGKKTYVLVSSNAQWYWLSEYKKNLWYPDCNIIISTNNNWSDSLNYMKGII